MLHDHHHTPECCRTCDFGTFKRNAYWMGKLMLPRDFIDEQRYFMDKLRHHTVRLHGWGVVCGLLVVPHETEACRSRFVCVTPGFAVDCCGHDIILPEQDCIDLMAVLEIQALKGKGDSEKHTLQICIRYRECPTEEVPVIYDDCGCETDRCAPNRILESYELRVLVDPPPTPEDTTPEPPCEDLWHERSETCELCDTANCVVLATIENYVFGKPIVGLVDSKNATGKEEIKIDNDKGRKLLPSTETIKEVIDCLIQNGGGTGGQPGKDGLSIDEVVPSFIDCMATPKSPTLEEINGKRVLNIQIPKGCDGSDGKPGIQGPPGEDGLDWYLPHICEFNWKHGDYLEIDYIEKYGLVVAFDTQVVAADLNKNSIHVLAPIPNKDLGGECWCELNLTIEPGQLEKSCDSSTNFSLNDQQVNAVRLRIGNVGLLQKSNINRLRVRINGDFIRGEHLTTKKLRALDADHLPKFDSKFSSSIKPDQPGWLMPGDNRTTGDGIEGGTFESWFTPKYSK